MLKYNLILIISFLISNSVFANCTEDFIKLKEDSSFEKIIEQYCPKINDIEKMELRVLNSKLNLNKLKKNDILKLTNNNISYLDYLETKKNMQIVTASEKYIEKKEIKNDNLKINIYLYSIIFILIILIALMFFKNNKKISNNINKEPDLVKKIDTSKILIFNNEQIKLKIKKELIGQDKAISIFLDELEYLSLQKNSNNIAPQVFFFSGPSGVGKTQLVILLAENLEIPFFRFNMNFYSQEADVWKLLGTSKGLVGADEGGDLVNALRKINKSGYPICLFLFDECEKAHKKIYQSLLDFFDEGTAQDSKGKEIAPPITLVILTSNLIEKSENVKEELLLNKFFSKELINRINYFINFESLNNDDIIKIIKKELINELMLFDLILDNIDEVTIIIFNDLKNELNHGVRNIRQNIKNLLKKELIKYKKEKKSNKIRIFKDKNDYNIQEIKG